MDSRLARGGFEMQTDDAAGIVRLERFDRAFPARRTVVVLNLSDAPRAVGDLEATPVLAAGPMPTAARRGWMMAPRSGALFMTE